MAGKSLMLCLIAMAALLVGQTKADCTTGFDEELKQLEIPQLARDIESELRKVAKPELANQPLADLVYDDEIQDQLVKSGFFRRDEVLAGSEACKELFLQVYFIDNEPDCEVSDSLSDEMKDKWEDLKKYSEACALIVQFDYIDE